MSDPEGSGAGVPSGDELSRLLDDLVGRVAGIRHAVLLTADGLAAGASGGLRREAAHYLASVACGFHRIATGAGRHSGAGSGRRTVVELDGGGCLFVAAAGGGSCLAVLGTAAADPGVVAQEVDLLAGRLAAGSPAAPHRAR
ncbi:MAG TPA: dynein regulation protein LC7 [Streptomyces sp.]|nr:dynein regulation protein LC7 [Streptomyces sp.]